MIIQSTKLLKFKRHECTKPYGKIAVRKREREEELRDGTYPKILPRRFPNECILISIINKQNPVIPNNRNDGKKWRHIEFDLELGLLTGSLGLISHALYGTPLAVGPSFVHHIHSSIFSECISSPCAHSILWLKPRRHRSHLVPSPHVPPELQSLHHFHLFLCHRFRTHTQRAWREMKDICRQRIARWMLIHKVFSAVPMWPNGRDESGSFSIWIWRGGAIQIYLDFGPF